MKQHRQSSLAPIVLGIEGGGTRTVAVAVDRNGTTLQRWEGGPANFRLMSQDDLEDHLRLIRRSLPDPQAIAIGLAGARTPEDWEQIRSTAARVWKDVPCHATHDLETVLVAAGAWPMKGFEARVVVISGTGSCCYGQNQSGQSAKSGGWGHVLGDRGSGYYIGLRGMQEMFRILDETGRWPDLGIRLLRRLQLNDPEQLVPWSLSASKMEVAALAQDVFAAAREKDRLAGQILDQAAEELAAEALRCAAQLVPVGRPVHFVLSGGNLQKQPDMARRVSRRLRQARSCSKVEVLQRESVWGAVELARRLLGKEPLKAVPIASVQPPGASDPVEKELGKLPTEQRNPRSMNLDRMSLGKAVDLMLEEDRWMLRALKSERESILRALREIVHSLKKGGRLFYAGAGTSGRLGVLDASECPPTFRTPPELVQGIIAGGQRALWESIEGAEDDASAGARALQFRGVRARDVVVGIAASGRTPFVRGALREARRVGAATIFLCFNPFLDLPPEEKPTVLVAPNTGPEVLTGSTRLKAGTATKIILNIFTTLAMVQLGKVSSNLMIDVNASNIKLRDRAIRIVQELTGAERKRAQDTLSQCQWKVKEAVQRLKKGGRKT